MRRHGAGRKGKLWRLPGARRVRQFARAMTEHMTEKDWRHVQALLPADALPLFRAMHPADQCHVLHVERTAEEMAAREHLPREERALLARCALLHDVGRVRGDLDVMGKVFAVLVMHGLPAVGRRMMCRDAHVPWRKLGHALYVYRHHPAIGAAKLRAAGLAEEAAIIAQHHEPPSLLDPPVLRILKAADEQN